MPEVIELGTGDMSVASGEVEQRSVGVEDRDY
jgi:hypothetical protein